MIGMTGSCNFLKFQMNLSEQTKGTHRKQGQAPVEILSAKKNSHIFPMNAHAGIDCFSEIIVSRPALCANPGADQPGMVLASNPDAR